MPPFPAAGRLAFETLEERRLLASVTVITHGAQFFGGLPAWTLSMAQAILDSADGPAASRSAGSIFFHEPDTGRWEPVAGEVWSNSNDADEPIVLVYDWASESATLADGWLEAAADNLFASLLVKNGNLVGELSGRSFAELSIDSGVAGLLDVHFIGHSRGAVLNSLVAERFDHYFPELTIDQITSLDGHPASPMNDRGYVATDPGLNSRIFTYDNVRFADNYYQQDGAYEPLAPPDFDGVAADGAYNLRLPSAVLQNGGSSLEHSDVHTWYYGTITAALPADYAGYSGAARNNDGDVSFPDAWWGGAGLPGRTAAGFAFSSIAGGDRSSLSITGARRAAGTLPTVFNGDLSLAVDGPLSDALPGWQEHSGAGTGPLGGSDLYFELNSGGDDYFRSHNPLYVPLNSIAVQYDYWITTSDPTPDDELQVFLGSTLLDAIPLTAAASGFARDRQAALTAGLSGAVERLEFRIVDAAGDGVESAVRIDNIELIVSHPAPNADFDSDGAAGGGDFLAWQRSVDQYFTAPHASGDADFDGHVLADDLAIWQAQFGAPAAASPLAARDATLNDAALIALSRADEYLQPANRARPRFRPLGPYRPVT
ncbi:MAG: hypothetical protein IT424_09035 [Pirellulales bacterium]|nr:hypothetical protein [Pirellulales bacterium]